MRETLCEKWTPRLIRVRPLTLISSAAHSISEPINQAYTAGSGERTSGPVLYQAEDVAALPRTQDLNLIVAYICSGYFAAQTLPSGLTPPRPCDTRTGWRRMTLIRCSCCGIVPVLLELEMRLGQVLRPRLGKDQRGALPFRRCLRNGRVALFRTRSKLERDMWC